MDLGFFVAGDSERGDEQERAEDVEDPFECLEERDTGEDEDGPQHERAEDAPEQDSELISVGSAEVAEDHGPNEDVVDGQALLDEVSREVLAGCVPVLPAEHHECEREAEGDPRRRFDSGFFEADVVRVSMYEEHVDNEQDDDRAHERGPHPGGRRRSRTWRGNRLRLRLRRWRCSSSGPPDRRGSCGECDDDHRGDRGAADPPVPVGR